MHCRGGVGRAGLVACCWTLKLGLCGWIEDEEDEVKGENVGVKSAKSASFTDTSSSSSLMHERAGDQARGEGKRAGEEEQDADDVVDVAPPVHHGEDIDGHLTSVSDHSAHHNLPSQSSDQEQEQATAVEGVSIRRDTMELIERVIALVRRRRSAKAVETYEQVKFLVEYVEFLRKRDGAHVRERAQGAEGENTLGKEILAASVLESDTSVPS